jgi:hypothetical protein
VVEKGKLEFACDRKQIGFVDDQRNGGGENEANRRRGDKNPDKCLSRRQFRLTAR